MGSFFVWILKCSKHTHTHPIDIAGKYLIDVFNGLLKWPRTPKSSTTTTLFSRRPFSFYTFRFYFLGGYKMYKRESNAINGKCVESTSHIPGCVLIYVGTCTCVQWTSKRGKIASRDLLEKYKRSHIGNRKVNRVLYTGQRVLRSPFCAATSAGRHD